MSKRAVRFRARPAVQILEEGVRLLRGAPPAVLLCHALGGAPCWLGALYYFTGMSRSVGAAAHVVGGSFIFAGLYVWMKCWQSAAAAHLRAALLREAAPTWDAPRVVRLVAAQTLLQPVGLVLRFWAAALVIPYVWVATFFQNVTVLGDGHLPGLREVCGQAWTEARRWPKQAHGLAAVLTVFGFFIYINVIALMTAIPVFLKTVLGIETVFSRHPQGLMNPTFFLAGFALTYLCLDPIRKAAVTLRCFYGGALESGEDLAVELTTIRQARRLSTASVFIWLSLAGFAMPAVRAEIAERRIEPPALNQSIDDVLGRREFAWRAPREKGQSQQDRELSWIEKTHRDFKVWFQKMLWKAGRGAGDWMRKVTDWLFGKRGDSSTPDRGFDWLGSVRFLVWGALILGAVLLALVVARRWRHPRTPAIAATPLPVVPDLRAGEVTADQLPEEGWLQLARELRQSGELRLALRASFLACLAHLGHRELILLARYKSDRDYDRELRRRARAQAEFAPRLRAESRVV